MKYSCYQDSFDIQSQKHIFGLWLRKALHIVNRIHRWLRFLKFMQAFTAEYRKNLKRF